ncbi:MAG: PD-(D/E)XK nuclease family protein, partial [Lachnospiraceae bacterium]|nr:PD-(D/E)XK nuclease family protein [Lachnospiraceae bacterium]
LIAEKLKGDISYNKYGQMIDEAASYIYPYETGGSYKNKYSVSDLKHEAILKNMEESRDTVDEAELPLFLQKEKPKVIPRFCGGKSQEEENRGALRGVAMHRFLECFDFERADATEAYEAEVIRQLDKGLLTEEQRELLSEKKLNVFLHSGLAERMIEAAGKGKLYKEHAFVMEHEMEPGAVVLVQGIIDAFFEEEDGIVLLDYKTDKVSSEEELRDRYNEQIALYAEAIEKSSGRSVKEKYLYSFSLDKAISCG